MNPNDPRSAYRIQRIQELLKAGDLDQWQLTERLAMSRKNVRSYVPYIVAQGLAHIVDWTQPHGTGPYIPTFRHGPGKSKLRPPAVPMPVRKKLYRDRVQRDPERRERLLSARRIKWKIRKLKGKPQPWFAALMGAA